MARPASIHPTELELEILKILWRDQPATIREVRDRLAERRDLAYTTVLTMMDIMTRKGFLKRAKKDGRFVYRAGVEERDIARGMLTDLVDRVFEGSALSALMNLIQSAPLSEKDIAELRRLIQRKKEKA